MTGKKTAPLSYRIPAHLKEELQKLADADRRKLGPYIQIVLEEHVESMKAEEKGGSGGRLRSTKGKR
jgi:predicted DNA-binding protein